MSSVRTLTKQAKDTDRSGNIFQRVLTHVLTVKFAVEHIGCGRADENMTISRQFARSALRY